MSSTGNQPISTCAPRVTGPPSTSATSCAPRQIPSTALPDSMAVRMKVLLGLQPRVGLVLVDVHGAAHDHEEVEVGWSGEVRRTEEFGAGEGVAPRLAPSLRWWRCPRSARVEGSGLSRWPVYGSVAGAASAMTSAGASSS